MNSSRVAILFDNLGPYHHARLSAAGRWMALNVVEIRAQSREYPWEARTGPAAFHKETLFGPGRDHDPLRRDIRLAVMAGLSRAACETVVIPGWSSTAALAALEWSIKSGSPAVLMSESCAHDEPRRTVKEWVKRQLVSLFRSALVGGTAHRDYLVQLGMPADRILLGYDVVDNAYFARELQSARCVGQRAKGKGRRSEVKEQPYFLASARFIEKKNLFRLIEAYARYRAMGEGQGAQGTGHGAEGEPWDLVLLGDGPLRGEIEALIERLGLEGHVRLPGFKQYGDLPRYYAGAGAFVHASTTEQWGLVVNEAMASGLPVIVSNRCGCAPDLVEEGVNGFQFDPFNVAELAELMHRMAGAACDRDAMSRASQDRISLLGPAQFAEGLAAAVEKAVALGPAQPTWCQRGVLEGLLRVRR